MCFPSSHRGRSCVSGLRRDQVQHHSGYPECRLRLVFQAPLLSLDWAVVKALKDVIFCTLAGTAVLISRFLVLPRGISGFSLGLLLALMQPLIVSCPVPAHHQVLDGALWSAWHHLTQLGRGP